MGDRRETAASAGGGRTWEVGAMERDEAELRAIDGGEPIDLETLRAVLALGREEPVERAKLESLFEGLGVRIGHFLAQQIREGQPARMGELLASTFRAPEVVELLSAAVLAVESAPARATPGPSLQPGRPGRRRRRGEPPPPCGKAGCGRPSRTRGFCQTHYVQWLRANRPGPA